MSSGDVLGRTRKPGTSRPGPASPAGRACPDDRSARLPVLAGGRRAVAVADITYNGWEGPQSGVDELACRPCSRTLTRTAPSALAAASGPSPWGDASRRRRNARRPARSSEHNRHREHGWTRHTAHGLEHQSHRRATCADERRVRWFGRRALEKGLPSRYLASVLPHFSVTAGAAPRADQGWMFSRSSRRLGCLGSQPSACRVWALEEGWSVAKIGPSRPKVSCGIALTGSPSRLPMTVAMSRTASPGSATACHEVPAGAFSRTSRKRTAASSACTAGQRWVPSSSRSSSRGGRPAHRHRTAVLPIRYR